MKLLLTSAGLINKSLVKVFEELVGKSGNEVKIAFVPTAANVESGDKDWLIKDLQTLKERSYQVDIVDISALPQDIWQPRLESANVLLFEGGNTFYLMSWIKNSGLENLLPELLKTRIYVGVSAGSMVATASLRMSTSQKSYSEAVFPLENDQGLGLVNFHVRPHLNSSFFPKVRAEYLAEVAKEIPEPIYAIDDQTAIKVVDDKIEIISEGKYLVYNQQS